MPEPGSHKFDIRRTRLRSYFERRHVPSIPDERADEAARAVLERLFPPRPLPPLERARGPLGKNRPPGSEQHGPIDLRSPAFLDHEFIPERYSLDGGNLTPPLEWSQVPEGAVELALLCEDLDSPHRFTHWVVVGIPSDARELGESLPPGARAGRNDYGELGWAGPHPPVGDDPHRYEFRLYALNARLQLPQEPTGNDLRSAVPAHKVGSGALVGLFER
jgi:Raf kinase inhibitor-like YbhB/YbcL family protein